MTNRFTKTALAALYFPGLPAHQATNRLRLWMLRCTPLMDALQATGYQTHQRNFTPQQVNLIYLHLGEP